MAAWLIPALKAVLPHVGTIISVAAPVFTKKTPAAGDPALLQQQIAELQAAASGNAEHIRALAAQLKTTVEALEPVLAVFGTVPCSTHPVWRVQCAGCHLARRSA